MSTDPEIKFGDDGLLPVVVQDARTAQVLMLAWANREALDATLASGDAHYYSRSRQELWRKGATSGNTQRVVAVKLDCDGDALLYQVQQHGPACHTGEQSCFHQPLLGQDQQFPSQVQRAVALLDAVIRERLEELPDGSYVRQLHERGIGYVAQKVVEEAGETVVAALQGQPDELDAEAADLLFHLTVLLHEQGSSLEGPAAVLLKRHAGHGTDTQG